MTHTAPTRRRFQQLMALAPLTAWLAHRPASAHSEKRERGAAAAPVVKEQKPWGIAAEPKAADRTIDIRMDDNMRFTPSHLDVREGETLHLRVANRGKVLHEIVIGTPEELQAHAELMKKHPGMQHDEPYMAHVPAGQRGAITWTFNRAGDFTFACLIPGHFDAGMRGTIRVKPLA
jgi:uncharacterized cupredoxin-like copper-binding protein